MGFFTDAEKQEIRTEVIEKLGLTVEELDQVSDFGLFKLYQQCKSMDDWSVI